MRGFNIFSLNICSLTCHHDELCVFMEDKTIDILGLNETKLDKTIPDSQVDIEGYDILRRDRNRNGGGVALYIKEARNSFSFFQSNKHILSLDTVRVIILRRNLAMVLSTHRRFLTLYFTTK